MTHRRFTAGGDRQLAYDHRTAEEATALLVIVHGLGEHIGCYDEFTEICLQAGVSVFRYDQQGHGHSPGRRGDAESFDSLIEDIAAAIRFAGDLQTDGTTDRLPLYVLGHSMGGNLLINYLLSRRGKTAVTRSILTNPMILPPNPPTKPQAFAAWLTGKLLPHLRFSADAKPQAVTRDPEVQAELSADELAHQSLALGVGGPLVAQGHWIMENASKLDVETLMMLSGNDELCDEDTTRELARRFGPMCRLKAYPEMRHHLIREQGRDDVHREILEWIKNGPRQAA